MNMSTAFRRRIATTGKVMAVVGVIAIVVAGTGVCSRYYFHLSARDLASRVSQEDKSPTDQVRKLSNGVAPSPAAIAPSATIETVDAIAQADRSDASTSMHSVHAPYRRPRDHKARAGAQQTLEMPESQQSARTLSQNASAQTGPAALVPIVRPLQEPSDDTSQDTDAQSAAPVSKKPVIERLGPADREERTAPNPAIN